MVTVEDDSRDKHTEPRLQMQSLEQTGMQQALGKKIVLFYSGCFVLFCFVLFSLLELGVVLFSLRQGFLCVPLVVLELTL